MNLLKTNKTKALFISLLLHSTLVAALVYSSTRSKIQTPMNQEKETKMIVSLLSPPPKSLTPKVVTPAKPTLMPKQTPKPKPKPRPIVKKKVPLKKVVEKKPMPPLKEKPTPQKETIVQETPLPPSEVSPKEVVKMASSKPTQVKTVQTPAPKQLQEISPSQLAQIRSMIQNSLVYPSIARRLKIEGVVTVAFVLSADGRVISADIVTRSGNSALDKKALSTVLALSGEYPHLNRKIDLQIPISFSLKNS